MRGPPSVVKAELVPRCGFAHRGGWGLCPSSALAGWAVLARRCEVLDGVAMLLVDERASTRVCSLSLTACAVPGGAPGVSHTPRSQSDSGALVELTGVLVELAGMALGTGVADHGHASRPLARVQRHGSIASIGSPHPSALRRRSAPNRAVTWRMDAFHRCHQNNACVALGAPTSSKER